MIYYSRFEVSILDHYRHVSDRNDSFSMNRITDFVFPTGVLVPASVPESKMQ
jgi:hypothetical protein